MLYVLSVSRAYPVDSVEAVGSVRHPLAVTVAITITITIIVTVIVA